MSDLLSHDVLVIATVDIYGHLQTADLERAMWDMYR
jgi:hypothetical protein